MGKSYLYKKTIGYIYIYISQSSWNWIAFFTGIFVWKGIHMTKTQKQQILTMRGNGNTYAEIAKTLRLNVNTVKSFCQRNDNEKPLPTTIMRCEQCKKPMRTSLQPSRRFCSDACRMDWWKSHPKALNRKAIYHFKCAVCRKPFTAYGNANRIYCSRKCYGKSRRITK